MATRITIETQEKSVVLHVTDSTGRDDWAKVPRYGTYDPLSVKVGDPDPFDYVTMVDKLDVLMHRFKIPNQDPEGASAYGLGLPGAEPRSN